LSFYIPPENIPKLKLKSHFPFQYSLSYCYNREKCGNRKGKPLWQDFNLCGKQTKWQACS